VCGEWSRQQGRGGRVVLNHSAGSRIYQSKQLSKSDPHIQPRITTGPFYYRPPGGRGLSIFRLAKFDLLQGEILQKNPTGGWPWIYRAPMPSILANRLHLARADHYKFMGLRSSSHAVQFVDTRGVHLDCSIEEEKRRNQRSARMIAGVVL